MLGAATLGKDVILLSERMVIRPGMTQVVMIRPFLIFQKLSAQLNMLFCHIRPTHTLTSIEGGLLPAGDQASDIF